MWRVSEDLRVKRMPNYLFLYIFPSSQEADRVLRKGRREFGNCKLLLDV